MGTAGHLRVEFSCAVYRDTCRLIGVRLVQGNDHYSSEAHGSRTVHSWIDEQKDDVRT